MPTAQATPINHPQFRLAVLNYGRILPKATSTNLGSREFDAQLTLLKQRGFHPVSASQVEAAYRTGASLPDKPLLLLFSGGYLSTYEAVHPVLVRQQTPATMFLETSCQRIRSTSFLFWDRLQIMLDSGIWQLGTHGQRVLGGSREPGEIAFESSRAYIEQHLKHAQVFSYMPLASLTPALSGSGAPQTLSLGFRADLFGVNTQVEDPRRLHCLEVQPSWKAEELIQKLEQASSAPTIATTMHHWLPGEKDVVTGHDSELSLQRNGSATLWCPGSRWLTGSWVMEARIKLESGPFWVLQGGSEDTAHWRLGGNHQTFTLQAHQADIGTSNQARIPGPGPGWHDLRVTRRGYGLWVEWDGKPASLSPLPLPLGTSGTLGICSGTPKEPGSLKIARLSLLPLAPCPVQTEPSPSRSDIEGMEAKISTLSAINPRWGVLTETKAEFKPLDQDRLLLLRGRFSCPILPSVRLTRAPEASDGALLTEWLRASKSAHFDGLVMDASELPTATREAWQRLLTSIPGNGASLKLLDPSLNLEMR